MRTGPTIGDVGRMALDDAADEVGRALALWSRGIEHPERVGQWLRDVADAYDEARTDGRWWSATKTPGSSVGDGGPAND